MSPVASVNSTSKVIRSRVTPDGVGHHRGRLGEDLALASYRLGQPGVSGAWEKPIAVWVSADSYVEQSTDSVIRISSTVSQEPLSTMPTRLVIPGWAPLPKMVELPCWQAFSIRARSSGVCLPPVIQAALVQTLTPLSSSATSSSMLGHSGL